MAFTDAFTQFSFTTWLIFCIVCFAAARIGPFFPRIGLPLVTGYLFAGSFAGPYVLGILSRADVSRLGPVTQFALAFIAFSAGAELYLPELRALFKRIFAMTTLIACVTFLATLATVNALSTTRFMAYLGGEDAECRLSVAAIVAAIMVARSPASAIAVITEMKARGPYTSTALGVTVLCDVYVLLAFTLTTTVAETSCRPEHESFSVAALGIMLGTILLSIAIGLGVGRLLLGLMVFKRVPARYLILPLGSAIFMACQALTEYSHSAMAYAVNLEPLLICITGGFLCSNQSSYRFRFLGVLQLCGPYVFLPFFVVTGASLDLSVLAASAGFALVVALVRAASIFAGSAAGGHLTRTPALHANLAWMALLTQAGVSMGLASEVGMSFPGWGPPVQTAIISVVLINQLVGPILFKWALRRVGEAGADAAGGAAGHDEDAEVPWAVVVMAGGVAGEEGGAGSGDEGGSGGGGGGGGSGRSGSAAR